MMKITKVAKKIAKKVAKKVAEALGEDKDISVSDIDHDEIDHKELKKLIEVDYPSFSSILPYRYFWEEKRLFINEHSIGFGLELTVFSGADEKLVNSISDLLRHRIRDKMDLQFILWGSNQVGNIIDNAYQHQLEASGIYSELAKASIQYYKKGAKEGFKNRLNFPASLREYRLFAFLSKNVSLGSSVKSPFNSSFNSSSGSFSSDKVVAEIEAARDDFIVELESAGISYIELNLKNFLPLLRSWINPNTKDIYPASSRHEEYSTISEQVVDKSFELINEPERLILEIDNTGSVDDVGDKESKDNMDRDDENNKNNENIDDHYYDATKRIKTKVTNLSIRGLPDEFALWQSPDNFFNVFRASQAIRCPFLISMHIRLIPQVEAKNQAQRRYLSTDRKSRSMYAKYFSGTQEAALEWKKIRDDLSSDTVRLAHSYFNLMLFSKDGEEKRDESAAISCYRYNGIELFNTKYMQLQSFLAVLPFMMSEGMYQDLSKSGRLKKLTTWNLANLLPIVADFKMCRFGVLLSSFRNQINFFDMYSDSLPTANYNIAVAATSGAGKSFLVQNLLSYVLSINGKCFVIDLGQSYRKFCEIVGGTYLEYTSLRLNPFSNIHSINESSEQIRDLLSVLASPSGVLDDVQEEYMRQAVIKAWEKKQRKTNIDDIIEALQELNSDRNDNRIKDLIVLLTRYSTRVWRQYNVHK